MRSCSDGSIDPPGCVCQTPITSWWRSFRKAICFCGSMKNACAGFADTFSIGCTKPSDVMKPHHSTSRMLQAIERSALWVLSLNGRSMAIYPLSASSFCHSSMRFDSSCIARKFSQSLELRLLAGLSREDCFCKHSDFPNIFCCSLGKLQDRGVQDCSTVCSCKDDQAPDLLERVQLAFHMHKHGCEPLAFHLHKICHNHQHRLFQAANSSNQWIGRFRCS